MRKDKDSGGAAAARSPGPKFRVLGAGPPRTNPGFAPEHTTRTPHLLKIILKIWLPGSPGAKPMTFGFRLPVPARRASSRRRRGARHRERCHPGRSETRCRSAASSWTLRTGSTTRDTTRGSLKPLGPARGGRPGSREPSSDLPHSYSELHHANCPQPV